MPDSFLLRNLIFGLSLFTAPLVSQGGEISTDRIIINDEKPKILNQDFEYSQTMLDWQEDVTGKPLRMLEFGRKNDPGAPGVLVSGAFWGNYLYEDTNVDGKFPILSRFPSERGNVGSTSDRWVVSNAATALTARPVSWITGFAQFEYSEVEFPGQEDWQYRKALVVLGDLSRSPIYAYAGRNTVDFGWMEGYNPFTHTVNNHSFRVDSDDAVLALGYAAQRLNVVGTLIPSGRQLRVADTEDDDGFSNGAINATYTFGDIDGGGRQLTIGGGYLHSTIYNNETPHHPGPSFFLSRQTSPDLTRNPAYDLFAEYVQGPFRMGVERTATTRDWPSTGVEVVATNFQAAYDFDLFDRATRLSVVYGTNEQGPEGAPFEKLTQLAIGLETRVTEFLTLSGEFVRNEAFVPLINIRNVSDHSVTANAFVIGGKIQF